MKTERSRPNADGPRESGERPRFELELAQELAPDTVVAGKYRVRSVLGRGGFAVVYDAEHLGLGREVALKVLHRTDGTPHVLIERFLREVRNSALVRHPNVLEVYDAGVHGDGSPFLAMEKICGQTLHQWLAHQKRLSVDETRRLSLQLLSALVAIGERGIVHRDVKPENLMLSVGPSGEVQLKLVDFGIALVHEASFSARLTQHGALVGTPHYMAPEQLRCELTDARADLYAAGVVMYQALTGVLPYDGADFPSLTVNVLNGKPRALRALCPECPRPLARVIERALEREPEQRFPDARSMLEALVASGADATARDSARETLRSLAYRARRLKPRPLELMVAAATVGLMTLWTSHAEVAAALRATFAGGAAVADEAADRPVQPAVAAIALPRPAPRWQPAPLSARELQPSAPEQKPAARARVVETLPPAAEVAAKSSAPAPRAHGHASGSGSEATARARALLRKGLTLYLHAEVDAAYAVYRRAARLAPNDPAAFRGLGLAASRLGRSDEAQRAFTRYLELSPHAPDAPLIRARLAALYSEEATRRLRGGAG